MASRGDYRFLGLTLALTFLAGCPKPVNVSDDFEAEWTAVAREYPDVATYYLWQQEQLSAVVLGEQGRLQPLTALEPVSEFYEQWVAVEERYPRVAGEFTIQQKYLIDLIRAGNRDVSGVGTYQRCDLQVAVQQDLCNGGRDGVFIRSEFCTDRRFEVVNISDCFQERLRCDNIRAPDGTGRDDCGARFQRCLTRRSRTIATVNQPVVAGCAQVIAQRSLCDNMNSGAVLFPATGIACKTVPYSRGTCGVQFNSCLSSDLSPALCYFRLRACLASDDVVVDGSADIFPPQPIVFFKFTDPTGTDYYPLGSGVSRALYGVFDTGTSKVRLNNSLPNDVTDGNFGLTDQAHLAAPSPVSPDLNVLLNGLQRRTGGAGGPIPFEAPGTANGAAAAVNSIRVNILPPNGFPTLLGGPVPNSLITLIDYTRPIVDQTGEADPVQVPGVTVEFFAPGDPNIPEPTISLSIQHSGNAISTDGATQGYRYWVREVTLRNRSRTAVDSLVTETPFDFLLDTGTDLTLIADVIAEALGLIPGGGTFDCYGGANNGYTLTSITFEGEEGNYVVNNANVCWQESAIVSPRFTHVILGGNLFAQVALLLNGPEIELAIVDE